MDDKIYCPKCGSSQLSANKKGFSGAKAVGGALIAGPLGVAAGTIGSNKVKITCLKCGHVFKPGRGSSTSQLPEQQDMSGGCLVLIVFVLVIIATLMFIIFW